MTGESFSTTETVAGELVFATGMTGYPESMTDPSYRGQVRRIGCCCRWRVFCFLLLLLSEN